MSVAPSQLTLKEMYESHFVAQEGFSGKREANLDMWPYEYEQFLDHTPPSERAPPGPLEAYQNEVRSIAPDALGFPRRSTFPIDQRCQFGDLFPPAPWPTLPVPAQHRSPRDSAPVDNSTAYATAIPTGDFPTHHINHFYPRVHSHSDAMRNEGKAPELYAPTGLSAARALVLSDWTDPQTYADASQNDAPFPLGQNLMSPRHSSIEHDRSLFRNLGASSFVPSRYGSHQEFTLENSSPSDLSCSRQRTPASGGIGEAIGSGQPWTPMHSYSEVYLEPSQTSSSSFSPRSVNEPAPALPTFAMSHSEIVVRGASLSSSHGANSENSSRLAERSLQPSPKRRSGSMMSCISIPSAPMLFADVSVPIPPDYGSLSGPRGASGSVLISGVVQNSKPNKTETDLKRKREDSDFRPRVAGPSRTKTEDLKRKRKHVCTVCGKDFNRPSALLLHSSVHTGERSNFCNVCGRSFSNLSNLRRHQKQLHVLESQMPLPPIPGPQATFSPYTFAERELYGF